MTLKVAVIGGGPAGLVTLKYLVEAHKFFPGAEIEAHLFEARDDIGGVFRYNVYEDAEVIDLFTTSSAPSPFVANILDKANSATPACLLQVPDGVLRLQDLSRGGRLHHT